MSPSRGAWSVAWVWCLLAAPIAAEGITRVLAAWTGAPHDAVLVAGASLLPVLLAGVAAIVRGSAPARVGWALGLLAALAAGALGGALLPALAALLGGAIAAHGLAWAAARAPAPRGRRAAVLWGILAVLAAAQVSRMSVFMADPARRWGAFAPMQFAYEHCCLSSYVHGAALARRGDANIYDDRYAFETADEVPELAPVIEVRPLTMDSYEYPPLFLPAPALLLALTGDFLAIRALWFLITAAIFAWTAAGLARWLGGDATRRAGLLALAVAIAPPALITAYTGNLQLAAIGLSALAMVWITDGKTRRGAALLAFMIGAKIFPGLLAVWLLASRRFVALAWTAAFGALYAALALALFGPRPYVDFVTYHLPRLASGETFGFLSEGIAVASNLGLFGLPFKLRALGWPASEVEAWELARQISWAFTLLVLVVAAASGWRARPAADPRGRARLAASWLGLLALGALRSPFAPPGLLIALTWGLSLQAAAAASRREAAAAAVLWVLLLLLTIPSPTPVGLAVALGAQALVLAVALRMALARADA